MGGWSWGSACGSGAHPHTHVHTQARAWRRRARPPAHPHLPSHTPEPLPLSHVACCLRVFGGCGGGAWRTSWWQRCLKPVHTYLPRHAGSLPFLRLVRWPAPSPARRRRQTSPSRMNGSSPSMWSLAPPAPQSWPEPLPPSRPRSARDLPITMPVARPGYADAHGARGLTCPIDVIANIYLFNT